LVETSRGLESIQGDESGRKILGNGIKFDSNCGPKKKALDATKKRSTVRV
jgi:hypothetical protein